MTTIAMAQRRPIVAIITHETDATIVAHTAVGIASERDQPVLLLIPIERPAFAADPAIVSRINHRLLRNAEILAAEAQPILVGAGFSAPTRVAWHGAKSFRRSRPARAKALTRAAHRARAAVIVTPVGLPSALTRGMEVVRLKNDDTERRLEVALSTSIERTAAMPHTNSPNRAAESPAIEGGGQVAAPFHRPPWTFLTNHGHVLITVASNPDMLVHDIAETVGITPRGTLHILADLEEAGYLNRTKSGRRTHYTVKKHQHFRHPSIAHQEIDALLNFLSPTDGQSRNESL